MTLPRYVTLAQAAEGVTKYRYNPPQDAVDAGVVESNRSPATSTKSTL